MPASPGPKTLVRERVGEWAHTHTLTLTLTHTLTQRVGEETTSPGGGEMERTMGEQMWLKTDQTRKTGLEKWRQKKNETEKEGEGK